MANRTSLYILSALAAVGRIQDTMFLPALLLAGKNLGWSNELVGLFGSVFAVTSGFSAIPKGKLADRFGLKAIGAQVILSSFFFALIVVALISVSPLVALAGTLLLGLSRVNAGALMQSVWADDRLPKSLAERGMSWEVFINTLSQVVGPLLAGGVAALLGFNWAIIVAGILIFVSMGVWSLPALHLPEETSRHFIRNQTRFYFTRQQILLFAISATTTALFALCQFNLIAIYPGVTPTVLLALFALGGALAALYMSKQKVPEYSLSFVVASFITSVIFIGAAVYLQEVFLLVPLLIIGGTLYAWTNIALRLHLRAEARNSERFTAWGGLISFSSLGAAVGFALPGLLGTFREPSGLLLVVVIGAVIIILQNAFNHKTSS